MRRKVGQPQGPTLSKSSFKLELVARLSSGATEQTRRQLEDRMCPHTDSETAPRHLLSHFKDLPLLAQKCNINRKFHPESVYRLTRDDPKTLTRGQTRVLQQTGTPLAARVGDIDRVAE
jgi:hypothetical protein